MELKNEFKQTSFGVIPVEWEIVPVGGLVHFINGVAHERSINSNGQFVVVNSKFISSNGDVEKYCLELLNPAKKDDVLMVMSDVPNGKAIAKCFLVADDFKYTVNQRICILRAKEVEPQYLYFQINRNKYYLAFDDGVKQTNLRKEDVLNCPIPLPPTKAEQTAIATALSDMDNLIAGLEKLIEKKKAIKQGALQDLLRPKEGWVEVSLIQIADNKKELFDDGDWVEAEHIIDEGIRLIQTGNIGIGCYEEKEAKKYISEESFSKLRCKELKIGDLLICRLAEPAGRSCVLPDIGERKVITSVDVTIFRPRAEVANRYFLVNMFSTNQWFDTVSGMSGGTTHKRISRGALGKIKIHIPSISEQTKIALVLSDMDNDIQALYNKLSKYKLLKQGMMQELLTGKTRLV